MTDRDRVVAQLGPPPPQRAEAVSDALLAQAVREGLITPAALPPGAPPRSSRSVMTLEELLADLDDCVRTGDLCRQLGRSGRPPGRGAPSPRPCSGTSARSPADSRVRGVVPASRSRPERTLRRCARELLARISLIELSPLVLTRALQPFPQRVRTLDALHLRRSSSSAGRRWEPALASYDKRMLEAARSWGSRSPGSLR